MAVIALLIAVESEFPVFYSQTRFGYDGRTFHIWKFRTMVRNAAEVLETVSGEQRRTAQRVGRKPKTSKRHPHHPRRKVLRKTSLDELPQLWNVIRAR